MGPDTTDTQVFSSCSKRTKASKWADDNLLPLDMYHIASEETSHCNLPDRMLSTGPVHHSRRFVFLVHTPLSSHDLKRMRAVVDGG